MYLCKDGRKHYLDFIRNITPQALLIFIGSVFWHGGLHGQPTLEKTAIGVVLWGMAAFAAWCNISLFLGPIKEGRVNFEKARARAAYPDIEGDRATRFKQSVKRCWSLTPLVVELVVVMLIIELAVAAAAISGGFSAVSALHLSS